MVPGPLDAEGEVYLEARPPEGEAARLSLAFQSIAALRADGTEIPLQLLRARLTSADPPFSRLIAWYFGFSVASMCAG